MVISAVGEIGFSRNFKITLYLFLSQADIFLLKWIIVGQMYQMSKLYQ